MKLTSSVHINAPVEIVFGTFSDLEQIKNNISGIEELKIISGPPQLEVGTTWQETRIMFGKAATEEMTVTSITTNETYTVTAASHGSKYVSTYTFSPKDGGITVTMTFVITPVSFLAKIMTPIGYIFKGSVKKLLEQDMRQLKEVIEKRKADNS